MKILYLLNVTSMSDGSTKSFLALLKGMLAFGHDACVLLPDRGEVFHHLQELGVPVRFVPFRPQVTPQVYDWKSFLLFIPILCVWFVKNICARNEIRKIVKSFCPDIIHTNSSVVGVGFDVARSCGIPHVYHIREYGDKDFHVRYIPSRRSFRKQLLQPNSYSICITRGIQRYNDLQGVDSSCVIYNGIAEKGDFVWPMDKGRYFLYAGRIEKTKGLMDLLEAYCEYVKKVPSSCVFPLYVAGRVWENNYYNDVRAFVRSKSLDDIVLFLGNRTDISELMNSARAIIVPSHNEGFGRSMAEAMFKSCLVLGYNVAGTAEQFQNGRDIVGREIGLPYLNRDELVQKLVEVSTKSIEEYKNVCQDAFTVVNQLYSVDNYVQSVHELYQRIKDSNGCR